MRSKCIISPQAMHHLTNNRFYAILTSERRWEYEKTKIIVIICSIITVLLCLIPIPLKLKDGGTTYLKPIVPMYEIYIYNTETLDENDGVIYKKGYGIYLFGIEICENVYYVNE